MIEGEMVQLLLRGRGFDEDFVDFVIERGRRFSLHGSVALTEDGSIRILAAGPAALVDMLEVACLLGPVHCLVDDIARESAAGEPAPTPFARTSS